jgi:hypothetical protein
VKPADRALEELNVTRSVLSLLLANCIAIALVTSLADAQQFPAAKDPVGLPIGDPVPSFSARDQHGRDQTIKTVAGEKGTVLLFFRSADW